ncbi:hypothetical protein WKV34_00200 (plasmid) [Enterobacter bugandensis]|uniref:hypothetical protein n=1 Tax=Enterobacter bugandensis TaxID=881260 RepID=UPI0030D355E5
MRPAITSAATSCAGRERSRASASPAVTICTLPERWRGAPAVPDTRGHLRSSAPGHHHGGNFLRGAGTVTRQRVTCRHDLHTAGTLARRSGCAGHQGASAQQCARPSPRRQLPARGGNGHAPARHLPSRSAPCRNAGAALRLCRTPGGICAAVRPAITTAATSCGAGTVTRQRVTCRHDLHPAGMLARRSGCAGHQGASAQQCARPSPRRQPPAGRERSRASASPAVTICTQPERWRGAPAVPDTRGHLRSSAPGQHHGGNLLRGAGTVTRQRVTCRHDLHPAGTLARRSGCAGHQGASAQQCARPSPRRQLPARGGNGHAPARHLPSRSAHCRNAGAALRLCRTPGGICAAVRPAITTAATSCGAGTVTRQRVTCRHDLHPAGMLARRSGCAGHQGASAQQCARPSPRRQPPAGRERSRASASPAVTICTLPERWRGAPAVPDARRHLRSSTPGQHHGGNLLRGAGTVTRQRVTCRHDLHPAGTLARRSGCAGHQGASAQQCARTAPRRQPPARGGKGHAPARHLPSRSAPCRNAGAALRLCRTPGGICAAVRPAITTAATSCAGRERSRASASPAVTICPLPER